MARRIRAVLFSPGDSDMSSYPVNVFFYGSYMNFDVLQEVDIDQRAFEICRIGGYELTIAPLANLSANALGTAYGILTKLTHAELDRLYRVHAEKILGGRYLPEALAVRHPNGVLIPALCYISHNMKKAKAKAEYIEKILKPAQVYGFPQWYLDHIASFR